MVAAPTVSMFQTAMIKLRMLIDVAFVKRRSGCVAYADGRNWSCQATDELKGDDPDAEDDGDDPVRGCYPAGAAILGGATAMTPEEREAHEARAAQPPAEGDARIAAVLQRQGA